MQWHFRFCVLSPCPVDAPGAQFCTGFAATAVTYGLDVLMTSTIPVRPTFSFHHLCLAHLMRCVPLYCKIFDSLHLQSHVPLPPHQETYNAVSDTATIAAVAAALTQLQTKNYRCIILYLSLGSAINVMDAMYAMGMWGPKYFVVLSPILRTPQLFQTGALEYLISSFVFLIQSPSFEVFGTARVLRYILRLSSNENHPLSINFVPFLLLRGLLLRGQRRADD
jgi:hypothetical protein